MVRSRMVSAGLQSTHVVLAASANKWHVFCVLKTHKQKLITQNFRRRHVPAKEINKIKNIYTLWSRLTVLLSARSRLALGIYLTATVPKKKVYNFFL